MALTVLGILLAVQNEGEIIFFVQTVGGFTGFAVVGTVLVARRPQNLVGWMLLCAALAAAAYNAAIEVATYGLLTAVGSVPMAVAFGAAFLTQWLFAGFFVLLGLAIVLFPTGRLPSPGWRRILIGAALLPVAGTTTIVLGIPDFGPKSLHLANPWFVPLFAPLASALPVLFLLLCSPLVVGVAALVGRYRTGSSVERQQLKWVLYAGVLLVGFSAASLVPSPFSGVLVFVSLVVFPVGIAIAILRHRLYDIDLLINRTVVYAATTATIAAAFFGGIVALQAVLRPLTAGSEVAVAASTLVCLALFQPIRRRLQSGVDRRFNRAHHDAARTLEAFADRLRDEVDLDALRRDLLDAVGATMAPTQTSLWLRGPRR